MSNTNEESPFQKFKRFFEAILDGRKINVEFSQEDVGHLKMLLIRAGYTMSTDWNKTYKDEEICRNILTDDLMLKGVFDIDELSEKDLPPALVPRLNIIKQLEDGDSAHFLEPTSDANNRYYFCRDGNKVLGYMGRLNKWHQYKIDHKYVPFNKYLQFKRGFGATIPRNAWGEGQPNYALKVIEGPNKKLTVLTQIPNNFFLNSIRFYDENGEITDLSNLDYTNCIQEIRNAITHNNYDECAIYEKVIGDCKVINNVVLVLMVDRRKKISAIVDIDLIYHIFKMLPVYKQKEFVYSYMPYFEPMKKREDCIELFKHYRVVKISLSTEEYNAYFTKVYSTLKDKYNSMFPPKDLKTFLESELKNMGYDAKVTCEKIGEMTFEKVILPGIVNSESLYNLSTDTQGNKLTDEQICEEQTKFITTIISGLCDYKIDKDQNIVEKNGDLKFISCSPATIRLIIEYVFGNLKLLLDAEGRELFFNLFKFGKPIYSLFLVYLCICNNLIDNNYNDDVKTLPKYKNIRNEAEILSEKGKFRDKINEMNFDGIKIRPAKGGIRDVADRDKGSVINKIRNGIHTSEKSPKGNRSEEKEMVGMLKFRVRGEDNFKTMPLVFSPVNEGDWAVQTDLDKFLKFIDQFPQRMHKFKSVTWKEAEKLAIEKIKNFSSKKDNKNS